MRRGVPRVVALTLAVLVSACSGSSSSGPTATPPDRSGTAVTVSTTSPDGPGRTPQGYRAATIEIVTADGRVTVLCVWVADTPALRARGLMEVDGLGAAAGMLFRFGEPSQGAFYMLRTRIPLSIAYFDADGTFAGAQDMVPCPDDDDDPPCPRYPAPGTFTDAIEVAAGDLAALGIGPGSRLRWMGTPCPGA